MAAAHILEFRHTLGAHVAGIGAAGAEGTAGGGVQRAGNVAGEHNALVLPGHLGVGQRYRGHEAPGVGVQGVVVDFPGVRQLHHFTKVHHGDSVGNVPHNQQIVGDEQIGQTHFILQLVKHIDDLGLNGHVQSGHRLIADHELGLHGQGPGDADALPLTAGEFVGIAVGVLGVQAHLRHQLQNPLLALFLV